MSRAQAEGEANRRAELVRYESQLRMHIEEQQRLQEMMKQKQQVLADMRTLDEMVQSHIFRGFHYEKASKSFSKSYEERLPRR